MDGTLPTLGPSSDPKRKKLKVNEPSVPSISGLKMGRKTIDPDLLESPTSKYEIGFDEPTTLNVPLEEIDAEIAAKRKEISQTIDFGDQPTRLSTTNLGDIFNQENIPTKLSSIEPESQPPQSKLDLVSVREQAQTYEAMEVTKVEGKGNQASPAAPVEAAPVTQPSPVVTVGSKSAKNISNEPEILVYHLPISLEEEEGDLSFEELLKIPKLRDSIDPYMLYRLFNKNIDDPRLRTFLERAARNPWDATLFWENRHASFMTPEVIHSILLIGSKIDYYIDRITKQKSRLFIYTTPEFRRGGVGAIAPAYYAFEDDRRLHSALIKQVAGLGPDFPGELSEEKQEEILRKFIENSSAFDGEKHKAEEVQQLIDNNRHDARIRNILYPIYIGSNYILMSHKTNAQGESLNMADVLKQAGKEGANRVLQETARVLIGAVRGLEMLTENQYINCDLKPQNIVDTEYDGCLIDWGGITSYGDIVDPQEKIHLTDLYNNLAIAQKEAEKALGAGTSHKFALARIIERIFYLLQGWSKDHMGLNPHVLPQKQNMILDDEQLNTPGNELFAKFYQLYCKLFNSYQHSFVFKNNDRSQGPDPEFISTGRIIDELEEIAKYKPKQND